LENGNFSKKITKIKGVVCIENLMTLLLDWWLNVVAHSSHLERLGIFTVTWILLWLPVAIPIAIKLQWIPFAPLAAAQKLPLLAPLYLVAPIILWGFLPFPQNWSNYGLTWLPDLALLWGLGIASLSLGLVFGWEIWRGWVVWKTENIQKLLIYALPILLLALWIGVSEEVIFRGFMQIELAGIYGFWLAGTIASLIFALLHLLWERQQTLPQIPGLWLMGMVLTGAVWLDQQHLWLAIGLHAGWVWGLTCLDAAEMISYQESAPTWFVGKYQQPLAGISGILVLIVTGLVLFAVHVVG
jgi:uncharacterized protein